MVMNTKGDEVHVLAKGTDEALLFTGGDFITPTCAPPSRYPLPARHNDVPDVTHLTSQRP